jgi:hypothetical protein
MINNNQKINLPFASRNVISNFLKRGGVCRKITGTSAYSIYFGKNIFNFIDMHTPATSYAYGILFLNKKNIYNILKQNNIKISQGTHGDKNYRVCVTRNGYCNILFRNNPKIIGNGWSTFKELLIKENLRRINNPDLKIMPVKIDKSALYKNNLRLSYVPKAKEKIILDWINELEEGATFVDVTVSENKVITVFAKKIIDIFPGLNYLSFDYYGNEIIGNVDLSLSPNVLFMMKKGASNRQAAEIIADLIVKGS